MSDATIVKENNPAVGEFLESWIAKYSKSYNFSKESDQADFYEGVAELGKHIALQSVNANIQLTLSTSGMVALSVGATPKPVSPSSSN